MGALHTLSELCHFPLPRKNRRKDLKTVEMKVKMDCEGCERKVKKAVEGMTGVAVDPKQHKLSVAGYVDPDKVLDRVRQRTGKKVEFWPYVPYEAVEVSVHPYAPGVYDKKAPPWHVRNPLLDPDAASLALVDSMEIKYSTAFSDENPNACVVM